MAVNLPFGVPGYVVFGRADDPGGRQREEVGLCMTASILFSTVPALGEEQTPVFPQTCKRLLLQQ